MDSVVGKIGICLHSFFVVIISFVAIDLGLLLVAVGCVLTFGLRIIANIDSVRELLQKLEEQLTSHANPLFNIDELIKSASAAVLAPGIILLLIGIVIIVGCCVGCCGLCTKNRACLGVYAVGVGLVFLAHLTVVIIWYANANIMKLAVKQAMEAGITKYEGFGSSSFESMLQDLMHIVGTCCGFNNGSDFQTLNTHWNRQFVYSQGGKNVTFNLTYPATCCNLQRSTSLYCLYNSTDSNNDMGCYQTVQ